MVMPWTTTPYIQKFEGSCIMVSIHFSLHKKHPSCTLQFSLYLQSCPCIIILLFLKSLLQACPINKYFLAPLIFTSSPFLKTAGGIVLGSVAVSTVSADVLPYISVAIKASFLKLGMCNICKNNIAKMFLEFF